VCVCECVWVLVWVCGCWSANEHDSLIHSSCKQVALATNSLGMNKSEQVYQLIVFQVLFPSQRSKIITSVAGSADVVFMHVCVCIGTTMFGGVPRLHSVAPQVNHPVEECHLVIVPLTLVACPSQCPVVQPLVVWPILPPLKVHRLEFSRYGR